MLVFFCSCYGAHSTLVTIVESTHNSESERKKGRSRSFTHVNLCIHNEQYLSRVNQTKIIKRECEREREEESENENGEECQWSQVDIWCIMVSRWFVVCAHLFFRQLQIDSVCIASYAFCLVSASFSLCVFIMVDCVYFHWTHIIINFRLKKWSEN